MGERLQPINADGQEALVRPQRVPDDAPVGSSSLDTQQIFGQERLFQPPGSMSDISQSVNTGTPALFDPPIIIEDYEQHHLPYNPFDPAENARRAEILTDTDRELGLLERISPRRILTEIGGSRRFEGYLREYAAVLGIEGISSQDIRRFKVRADKAYRGRSSDLRLRMVDDMKRNLELLIEDRFDADLVTIAALKGDAGITQELVEKESLAATREFKPARREDKIKKLRSLRTQREDLLISNYPIYLRLWQDLNPDGINIEAMRTAFEMASANHTQQLALAEKLYADLSNSINQRALAYTTQWKQLTIDQGLPSEIADEKAHLLILDATAGPMITRVVKMQEIRSMTEELLLKTFGISSRLWTEMTTGNLETQHDLDASFESPNLTVDNKIKLAKGIYRKIDKRLIADSTRLFTRLAAILREKGKLGEFDITLKTNRRQAQLKSLSRPEQYEKIKVWSRALGLEPETVPTARNF
ncbi:MAG: hypothetical protein HYW63_01625 [Candidatus Levybacteria bacterium]|nr:hypothetical protein [Candidatus Levybacteria bacterium]